MGTSSFNSIDYNGKSINYGQCLSDGHPNHAGLDFLTEIKKLIEKYGLEEFIRLLKEVEFEELEDYLKEEEDTIEDRCEKFFLSIKEFLSKNFETDVENKKDIDGNEDNDPYTLCIQSSYSSLKKIIEAKVGYTNNDCSGLYNYVLDLDTLTVGLRFHEEDNVSLSDIDKLIKSWKY